MAELDHAVALAGVGRVGDDPVEAIKEITEFGADVTIDAVGNPVVFQQAYDSRDLAGTTVLVITGPNTGGKHEEAATAVAIAMACGCGPSASPRR